MYPSIIKAVSWWDYRKISSRRYLSIWYSYQSTICWNFFFKVVCLIGMGKCLYRGIKKFSSLICIDASRNSVFLFNPFPQNFSDEVNANEEGEKSWLHLWMPFLERNQFLMTFFSLPSPLKKIYNKMWGHKAVQQQCSELVVVDPLKCTV